MGRSPCCSKEGLNRGAWTAIEDKILTEYIKAHGEGKWRNIPKAAGLKRCGKSCRLRWLNYLRPDIKRGNLTEDEEDLIVRLHRLLGNRWSLIAGRLPGRTDNEIKNYWNTKLSKRAQANQSNHLKIEKKPEIKTLNDVSCPGVIKSKAVQCTRSLVNSQQHKSENHGTDVVAEAPFTAAISEFNDGSSSFPSKEESPSDYMIDFDVGGINLSEILACNFIKLNDFDDICTTDNGIEEARNNESNAKLDPFEDEIFLVNEKMVENWNGSDCFQAKMESGYGNLASFLESSEEYWMI